MPTAKPRISNGTSILTDTSGNHLTGVALAEYTGPPPPENVEYDPSTGNLSWDAVTTATSFKIYASDPSATDPEALSNIATVTAQSYSASTLSDADRRTYAVTAVDEHVNVESTLSKPAFAMGSDRRLT